MNNSKWKCVFRCKNRIYFAKNSLSRVYISDGIEIIREYDKENVTGCTYNGERLWISTKESNEIVCIDSNQAESSLPILSYDTVCIVGMITGQKEIMVLKGLRGDKVELFLFDGIKGCTFCKLPIYKDYIDFVIESDRKGFLLCEESMVVPRIYEDDVDDTKVLFFAEIAWNIENIQADIVRAITLYIDNNYDCVDKLSYGDNLRFPLFDQYLWKWLVQKSFSSSGKYVVYYSEDINGIIIGNPVGGEIHRLVSIPTEIAGIGSYYYYNDISEELFIITQSNEIKRYIIHCDSEEAIIRLNNVYDDAYNKKRSLSLKDNPGDMTFINILYHALGSCTCKPLGLSTVSISDFREFTYHISLTVKTPVSGKVILEKDRKELGYIDCDAEEFEKVFDFEIADGTFGIIFITGSIEKTVHFNSSVNCGNFEIDMKNHLNFEEIVYCCNRAVARRKLQTYPTDMYAIYQLGWVGTEEDLNFLLGILEDDFSESTLCFGDDGNRVWNAVKAVSDLSNKYKRNDAIPLLKAISKIARNGGMLKTAELIDNCQSDLESHGNFSSFKYRVDILIRTPMLVQVYLNSKDNWIAEIDGTVGHDKIIDWCCIRSNREKFTLVIESVYGEKSFNIDIQNNDIKYRQVLDVKPPVFSRELAQEVLESRGDRILAIPEGIEVLAGDFAYMFDEREKKYHFYEIDIPASVTTIEPLYITSDPGEAWGFKKDFNCFDEIIVANDNNSFCSVDGVLFTKNMKKLICYPCGKPSETYTVPDRVETIGASAFQCNKFLKNICLPSSIRTIEWDAFGFCEKLNSVSLPDGLEIIDEDAFSFCNIKHMSLPKSLKKIHWSNLSSIGSGILNMEIPDAEIEIDMSGYDAECEYSYESPLFLVRGRNLIFEKYARRHKRNIIQGYYTDDKGIVWAEEGRELVEFPLHWTSDIYRIPEMVTGIHRWAFNQSDVKQIIATRNVEIKGNTAGHDFSRLASEDDFEFEKDFFIVEDNSEMNISDNTEIGKLIILSGPSDAGKEEVANILVTENENYMAAVTATTRDLRKGEVLGENYVFLTKNEFKKGIQEERFIEYNQCGDDYYGTPKDSVYSVLKQGKNVVLKAEFAYALEIRKQNDNTLLVYIMPPDIKTTIEHLNIDEKDDEQVRDRLSVYAAEIYSALRGDILLINKEALTTANVLTALVDDPKKAKEIYDKNVELVVELKRGIERYLDPSIQDEQKSFPKKAMEYLEQIVNKQEKFEEGQEKIQNDIREVKETANDTNGKVTSFVHFIENDLQTWIASNRPKVDDETLIEQFAHQATDYINTHVQGSNQMVQEEKSHLQNIFGNTWNKLLPTTQSSLISAGVLWSLCANISMADFDYSGVVIAATSALESELKRVFFTDFQNYLVSVYGNPEAQDIEKTYDFWPERLLNKTKTEYEKEIPKGSASLPKLADNFTMGTLPYMFYDKDDRQKNILRNRMKEYLRTIVNEDNYDEPLKAFNDYSNDKRFVKQCESIRTLYRNPAGHVEVLPRESAEECYNRIVGVGKLDAFKFTNEIQGLIMMLYSKLR